MSVNRGDEAEKCLSSLQDINFVVRTDNFSNNIVLVRSPYCCECFVQEFRVNEHSSYPTYKTLFHEDDMLENHKSFMVK